MRITLIFARIISFMLFTVLLLLMYFILKDFRLSIHVDSRFLKNDKPRGASPRRHLCTFRI